MLRSELRSVNLPSNRCSARLSSAVRVLVVCFCFHSSARSVLHAKHQSENRSFRPTHSSSCGLTKSKAPGEGFLRAFWSQVRTTWHNTGLVGPGLALDCVQDPLCARWCGFHVLLTQSLFLFGLVLPHFQQRSP